MIHKFTYAEPFNLKKGMKIIDRFTINLKKFNFSKFFLSTIELYNYYQVKLILRINSIAKITKVER